MEFPEVNKSSGRKLTKKDKEDEQPLSMATQENSEQRTPPGTPKRGHHKVNSAAFKKKTIISEVQELEEQNDKQNGEGNESEEPDILILDKEHQVPKEEEYEEEVCVAMRVNYLQDLETEYNRNDLKQFIMSHLNKDSLFYEDVAEIIVKGAEINQFMNLEQKALKKMIKVLNLPLDDEEQFKSSNIVRKFTVAAISSHQFQNKLNSGNKAPDFLSLDAQEGKDSEQGFRRFGTLAPSQYMVTESSTKLAQGQLLPGSPKEFKCIKDQVCRSQLFLAIICLITLAFFLLGGLILSEKNLKYFGSGLWLARASAFAILILTTICIFTISRDLLTALRCRGCCGAHCSVILNEHLMYHKFCGFLIMVFSVLHTIGHLYGTYPAMANASDLDELNDHMTLKKFDKVYGYAYLLFGTVPGLTGVIMLIAILLIYILSLPCIRRRKWEVFSYSHLLYYVFLLGMIIHGFGGWFNNGIPPTAFIIGFVFLMLIFQMIRRWCQTYTYKTKIQRLFVHSDQSYIYVKLYKPAGMMVQPGQYMFLNFPNYSKHQWHPFSIASGTKDDTVNFIIKSEGGFTKFLISQFQGKSDMNAKPIRREIYNSSEMQEDKIHPHQCIEMSKLPEIRMNGPFGAPCQSAVYKRTCVFVGAGVGITPFLAFLRSMSHNIVYSTYVFICRDPALIDWVSMSIKGLKLTERDLKQNQILLFLTKRQEVHCLNSFLFWRAFLLTHKKQQEIAQRGGQDEDAFFDIPVKVSYKRPNLENILIDTAEQSSLLPNMKKEVSVYSCAPSSFNNRLRSICQKAGKKVKYEFAFYPEIFG